jgi:uncharacterized RDD family membrane protein YckC
MFCSVCGAQIADGAVFCARCGSPQGVAAPPPAAPAAYAVPAPAMDYASWGSRAAGYIIDNLLVGAVVVALGFASALLFAGAYHASSSMGSFEPRSFGEGLSGFGCCFYIVLIGVSSLLVGLYNRVYLVAKRGCSIGQGAMNLLVVNANGQFLSQGTALLRLLAQIVIGFVPLLSFLDLLWPLWDVQRQTLHDKAVGSFVINNPRNKHAY